MCEINVLLLAGVYVLECCSLGQAHATSKRGFTAKKQYIILYTHRTPLLFAEFCIIFISCELGNKLVR